MILTATGSTFFFAAVAQALRVPIEAWAIDLNLYLRFLAGVALLIVTAQVAYRVAAALTLAYGLDRNGFYIFWLGNRMVVPLGQIESVERSASVADRASLSQSLGYFYGGFKLPSGKIAQRFSTLPTKQAIMLQTSGQAYIISPNNTDTFVQELEQRQRIGVIQQLTPGVEAGRYFSYAFWDDQVVRQALVLAFSLSLILLGWLASIYPNLPALIDLRSNAAGEAGALSPRHQILFLPLAAFATLLFNTGLGITLYVRTPLGARMLQMASAMVQLLFAVAVLTIVR
ncbi:PH domain-containing protein [Candidatus Oscillochloris fontis]|uniref:PH domain-containing protein n=1 Tax=Candidatus Oscillochloris fontis TaxID=2496868 RepID=UPI001375463C|nr:PH domain-containing protein [Candidatus Oscillochloris fontis]